MNLLSPFAAVSLVFSTVFLAAAQPAPCGDGVPCGEAVAPVYYQYEPVQPSWVFAPSTYTHDPYTGARVAQYQRLPAIQPLDDPRMVTSRYRRVTTNLRGSDGSLDSTYEVQNWGNGRGGLDAEWERFHNAWRDSYLTGGFYNQNPGFVGGNPGWGWGGQPWSGYPGGYPNGGYGMPGYGNGGWLPNQGFPPNQGQPGQGFPPGHGQSPHSGPWNDHWPHGQSGQGKARGEHHDSGQHDD